MKYKYNNAPRTALLVSRKSISKKHRCKRLLNSKKIIVGLITVVGSALLSTSAEAQSVRWSPGVNPASGNWDDPNDLNWDVVPFTGTGDSTWANVALAPAGGISANFGYLGVTGGSVSILGAVSVGEVNFNLSNSATGFYVINGAGVLNLVPSTFNASPNALINSASNQVGRISADIDYTTLINGGQLEINGAVGFDGLVVLQGDNDSNSAGVLISRGALGLQGGQALGDLSAVDIANSAELVLINSGETVGSLNSVNTNPANSTAAVSLQGGSLALSGNADGNFAGLIWNTGGLIKDGSSTQILSGANTYGGLTIVNDGVLHIQDNDALGASGDYVTNGTVVNEGGILALSGGISTNERITLINSASLINDMAGGVNSVEQMVLLEHDPQQSPNSPIAHIGSHAGSLYINGGILNSNTAPNMSLDLNTKAADLGDLVIDSVIGASVQDVTIGNSVNFSSSVHLMENNQYAGNTMLNGGTVHVGSNGAFSNGLVTVAGTTTIEGGGATLPNDFQIDPGMTLWLSGEVNSTGEIAGSGDLSIRLNSNVTLTGSNTYSGESNVFVGGQLNVENTLLSPIITVYGGDEGDGVLNTNGTELLDNAAALRVAGIWNLGGDETIGSLNGSGLVDLHNYELSVGSGFFSGVITNTSGGLHKYGVGTLILTGAQTYVGPTHVEGGTLDLSGASLLSNQVLVDEFATIILNGTTLANGSDLIINGTLDLQGNSSVWNVSGGTTGVINLNSNTLSLSGIDFDGTITGNGGVTVTGGNVTLDGNSTFGGTTLLTGGTTFLNGSLDSTNIIVSNQAELVLGNNHGSHIDNNATVVLGGTLNITGTETVGQIDVNGGSIDGGGTLTAGIYNLNSATVDANLGSGVLNQIGGTSLLNGDANVSVANINAGTLQLNGALTNGSLNVVIANGATLETGGVERINDNAVVTIQGGTWNLGGDETIGTLNGITGSLVDIGEHALTVSDGSYAGVITNSHGDLNKTGSGTLTLSGNNTYVGDTHIEAGTLNLTGTLQSAQVIVDSGATLKMDGSNLLAGNPSLAINSQLILNGTLDLDGNATIGALTGSSSGLVKLDGFTLSLHGIDFDGVIEDSVGGGSVTLASGNTTLDGNSTYSGATVVTNGATLFLNGSTDSAQTLVQAGGTLVLGSASGDHLLDSSSLTVYGALNMDGTETVLNASGIGANLGGLGTLTATSNQTYTNGSVVSIDLVAGLDIISNGTSNTFNGNLDAADDVLASGNGSVFNGNVKAGDELNVLGGANTFNGSVDIGDDLFVQAGAPLTVFNGDVKAADRVAVFNGATFNGGLTSASLQKAGSGVLQFGVNSLTQVGDLFLSAGSVSNSGSVMANTITVAGGTSWNNNGSDGTMVYNLLQGTGTVITADLVNANGSIISPSTASTIGVLTFLGDLSNEGTILAQLNTTSNTSDTVAVSGAVSLGATSTLSLNDLGTGFVDCGERFNVINAGGGITGAFGSILDTPLGTEVLFDIGSGDVVGTGLALGKAYGGIAGDDPNQVSVMTAITDSAIDGAGNYNSLDQGTGTLLDGVLSASSIQMKGQLLNELSPEGYAGAADYALHATRSYMETAMQVTPLTGSAAKPQYDAKGGLVGTTPSEGHNFQVFGGYNTMELGSDSSVNGHDYDLDSQGGYAGLRGRAGDSLVYGGFIGIDRGSVDAAALDLSVDGIVAGAFAHYRASDKLRIWSNIAYGNFRMDGHRTAFGATLDVDEFGADALQFGIGTDYDAYVSNGFKITSGLGLRYIDASTDSIDESGGLAALNIQGVDAEAFLLDLTVKFSYAPENGRYGLNGYLGYQHNFESGDRDVTAKFASGSPYFTVVSQGLGEDAFVYGAGGYYDITDDLRVGLNYRGESRSSADGSHAWDLRFTYSF